MKLLVLATFLQLLAVIHGIPHSNGFYYNSIDNGNHNINEIYFNGVQLTVQTPSNTIFAYRGSNVTLPCRYRYTPELTTPRKIRVKWSKLRADSTKERDVLVAIGLRHRSFREFKGRVHLRQDAQREVSLVIKDLRLEDYGKYKCEVIDGLEDESGIVELELRGVVFPYQPAHGRYQLNFHDAKKACEEQDAVIASFEQLFRAWEEGLDWCNAGWLLDGTVQYPITLPREPCGGRDMAPGVRSYGERHKNLHRYDVFCFSSSLKGKVYYLRHPDKLQYQEAEQACREDGAEIAKVGQLFAAWKFLDLDQCDAGWLADGSVRYPIAFPRLNCGPPEPGVRSFGFPDKNLQKYGVYCYKMT
ncbi:hyaluronan and proteoglycan link protein 3 [Latimeria chalumnae]|uniref:hyaluronan and proteoglycan link protein 3 n=1 Tax=Latimeria chalumnae TaxID=7897 RepID=UPI0003C19CE9|nr:PREDICTED: hyaluronan and proteoglycan link protein 3 [Latimeria chalumnae]|eukprot:XP_005989826.1 PREDICTED: hyaluronan and proteoglycan link protein 3 [Latimeria chalumnae]